MKSKVDFKCLKCCKQFPSKLTLNLHKQKKHKHILKYKRKQRKKSLPFKCLKCKKQLPSVSWFETHKKLKHKNVSATVKIKEEVTIEEYDINATIKKEKGNDITSEKTTDSCPYCDSKLKPKYLKDHIKTKHTSPDLWEFDCEQCEKKFATKNLLRLHMKRDHLKKEQFVCPHCQFTVQSKSSLDNHLQSKHTNPALWRYECHLCERRYATEWHLKRHEYVHKTINNFTCNVCKLGLSSKRSLKSHILAKHQNYNFWE